MLLDSKRSSEVLKSFQDVTGFQSVTIKIQECVLKDPVDKKAKDVVSEPDVFVTMHFGYTRRRTPIVFGSSNPYFGESWTLSEIAEEAPAIFTIWKVDGSSEVPLGVISIPWATVETGNLREQLWWPTLPPNSPDLIPLDYSREERASWVDPPSGKLNLKVESKLSKRQNADGTSKYMIAISCNIKQLTRLNFQVEEAALLYLALTLFEDPEGNFSQYSKKVLVESSINEDQIVQFGEQLQWLTEGEGKGLHVALWCQRNPSCPMDEEFLGHAFIPFTDLKNGHSGEETTFNDGWIVLWPRPDVTGVSLRRKGGMSFRRGSLSKINTPSKDLPAYLHRPIPSSKSATKKAHKMIEVKTTDFASACGHCMCGFLSGMRALHCKTCHLMCHPSCSKFISNNCGGHVNLKLAVVYHAFPILPLPRYEAMISVLSKNAYALVDLIEQDREEAALCIINIFDYRDELGQVMKYILKREIERTNDPGTLFRSNTMASKLVEGYIKSRLQGHLNETLGPTIRLMLQRKNVSCEVDPSRLPKGVTWNDNIEALHGFCDCFIAAIFGAEWMIPKCLRGLFKVLRRDVSKKFPDAPETQFTVVAGFIFLRFYAPAILNPKLWGLCEDYLNPQLSRNFTLCAKVLQTLANLVIFESKESYLIPMNVFIQANIQRMRRYIDDICIVKPEAPSFATSVSPEACAENCAKLHKILLRQQSRLLQHSVGDPSRLVLLKPLTKALEDISHVLVVNSGAVRFSPSTMELYERSDGQRGTVDRQSQTLGTISLPSQEQIFDARSGDAVPSYASSLSLRRMSVPTLLSNSPGHINQQESESSLCRRPSVPHAHLPVISQVQSATDDSISSRNAAVPHGSLDPIISNSQRKLSQILLSGTNHSRNTSKTSLAISSPKGSDDKDISESQGPETQDLLGPSVSAKIEELEKSLEMILASDSFGSAPASAVGESVCVSAQANTVNKFMSALESAIQQSQTVVTTTTTRPQCAGCNQECQMKDSVVDTQGKSWHATCCICCVCGVTLDGVFAEYEGELYCKEDFHRSLNLICGICGEYIDGEYVAVSDRKYHFECKKCEHCGQEVGKGEYIIVNDDVYCNKHRQQLFNCHTCGEPIESEVLVAMEANRRFHAEHFNCAHCGTNLCEQAFYEMNDKPYCQDCLFHCSVREGNLAARSN